MVLAQWLIAYAKRYGLDPADIYDVLDSRILSNAYNGQFNEKAYWNRKIEDLAAEAGFDSPQTFLRSSAHNPTNYWPLRLFDGPRRCDGAAVIILCASNISKKFLSKPVHVLGSGNAHGKSFSEKMYSQPFIGEAARQAYEMSGVTQEQIDIVELYDFVAPEYLIPLEDVGYFKRGEAWRSIAEGKSRFDSEKPVNTSGGSGAGSVVGSVGAVMTYYLVKQLRGEAKGNQVSPIPQFALMYDAGAARDCIINIYGR
jgi:acetyl-CoA acetyltransferase